MWDLQRGLNDSGFKVHHGIRKLDISGESKSANLPSAEEFVDSFAKIVEEHNLTSEQIYNANETGLFYRCLPRTTLASESEGDMKGFKQSKDRLTVLCCANMAAKMSWHQLVNNPKTEVNTVPSDNNVAERYLNNFITST
ncbi:hypothetical protein O3P69_015613 [Scylla paramamosain]|uniref:Uncharacterized protein n=1 Tax=Scylla paramamosain TaxID=85552 RepID=A0AAW0SH39_SCYPA